MGQGIQSQVFKIFIYKMIGSYALCSKRLIKNKTHV